MIAEKLTYQGISRKIDEQEMLVALGLMEKPKAKVGLSFDGLIAMKNGISLDDYVVSRNLVCQK